MPLKVEMVCADRTLWTGEAVGVAAPGAEGDLGILPGHQPVLTLLRPGKVRVRPLDGENVVVEAVGGFMSVDHDNVTLVVDPAESSAGMGHEG